MPKLGTVTFTGKSGTKYTFDYWDFTGTWNSVAGVYVISRYDKNANTITAIYVGETDDLKARLVNHHKQSCLNQHNANILCWLDESNSNNRLKIESDLVNGLNPPCNG